MTLSSSTESTLADLIEPNSIVPDLRSRRRDAVLSELARRLADQNPQLDSSSVVRALRDREQLGSTALGHGLAVPHAKLESIDRTLVCLGRSRRGIDFGAPDGLPTHWFFVLVAPPDAMGEHLKILARFSRLFRDAELRRCLLDAKSAAEIHEMLAAEEAAR